MIIEKPRLIPNYIYFYHLDKFCVLPLYPESINDNMSTSFTPTNALSRSAPVFTFSNSGPRTVQINIDLHRDMMNDVNTNVSNIKPNVVDFKTDDYVDVLINYLQAAALPKYNIYNNGAKAVEPPMVAIRFGNEVFIKGVVNSGIQVTYKKPILANNKYAQVNISFTVYETDPYDAPTVVKEGSFRGAAGTFKSGIYRTINDVNYAQSYDRNGPNSSGTVTQQDNQNDKIESTVYNNGMDVPQDKMPRVDFSKTYKA